jgi:CheY-like chemotaxis protein
MWLTKPLILLVDDDIQMVVMLRSNLETEGYRVEFATDGITGKQKAWDLKPDLIISDIFMPGVNGLAMMESINEHPELSAVPVIFLSGDAQGNILPPIQGLTRRYALMKKPIFLPELNELVRKFLSR